MLLNYILLALLQLVSIHALSERDALMQIYNATNGPNWINATNWGVGEPCLNSWTFVICSGGRVIAFETYNSNVRGVLPDVFANFTSMTQLGLQVASLTGPLPPSLALVSTMQVLKLTVTPFSGSINATLASMNALRSLIISGTGFTGPFPTLTHMTSLTRIEVNGVNFTGALSNSSIPWNRATMNYLQLTETAWLSVNVTGYFCTQTWAFCSIGLLPNHCAPVNCTCQSITRCTGSSSSGVSSTVSSSSLSVSSVVPSTSMTNSGSVTPASVIRTSSVAVVASTLASGTFSTPQIPTAALSTTVATELPTSSPTETQRSQNLAVVLGASLSAVALVLGACSYLLVKVRRRRQMERKHQAQHYDLSAAPKELQSYILGLTSILAKPVSEEVTQMINASNLTNYAATVDFTSQA